MKREPKFFFAMAALIVATILAAMGSCKSRLVKPAPITAEAKQVAADNNGFACDLYSRVAAAKPGNLVFSPYSISMCLAMVYAGSKGDTAKEMERVLHFSAGQDKLPPAFKDLRENLAWTASAGKYDLTVANSLWAQKGFDLLGSYKSLVSKNFEAEMKTLDFAGGPATAAKIINDRVRKQTRGKFPNLLGPNEITNITRLVLINAIYFKGKWENQFRPAATEQAPFFLTPEQKIEVPMMNQHEGYLVGKGPGLLTLEMPYLGGDLSMVILLPEKIGGIKELEASLTQENLDQWLNDQSECEVSVSLPRFKMENQLELDDTLKAMGMEKAFILGAADFSGLTKRDEGLFISIVLHRAFIEVNEKGTEAAAATAVMAVGATPAEPCPITEFKADHPFIFLILDRESGSILFLGRVMDPIEKAGP